MLVKPNVERVKLSAPPPSTESVDSEAYVHILPEFPQLSKLQRFWKPAGGLVLTAAICFALVFGPVRTEKGETEGSFISLAALAALQEEEILRQSAEESGGELTPVIYSGSEYQARIERELAKQLPLTEETLNSTQLIPDSRWSLLRRGVINRSAHEEELRSLVKFISGVIAVHRPNIQDCGAVAAAIVKHAAREKIDPLLIASIISVESRFGHDERSKVGAVGLMQLMPATAKEMAQAKNQKKPALTDIDTNIQLGIDYWKYLTKKYRGNNFLALSAYNWGPGNVEKVGRSPARIPDSVQRYSKTIIDRHKNWVKHFKAAKTGAQGLG
jgi:hypothetical protein